MVPLCVPIILSVDEFKGTIIVLGPKRYLSMRNSNLVGRKEFQIHRHLFFFRRDLSLS